MCQKFKNTIQMCGVVNKRKIVKPKILNIQKSFIRFNQLRNYDAVKKLSKINIFTWNEFLICSEHRIVEDVAI